MTMDNLDKKADELKQAMGTVDKRRQTWNDQTKTIILDTLNQIKDRFDFDWYVEHNDSTTNHESIYLAFSLTPAGIFDTLENKQLFKKGGYLCYSQTANSRIVAWISYPHIEDIKGAEQDIKTIKTYEPQDISADEILQHAETFLTEMTAWEKNAREPVGFKGLKDN